MIGDEIQLLELAVESLEGISRTLETINDNIGQIVRLLDPPKKVSEVEIDPPQRQNRWPDTHPRDPDEAAGQE